MNITILILRFISILPIHYRSYSEASGPWAISSDAYCALSGTNRIHLRWRWQFSAGLFGETHCRIGECRLYYFMKRTGNQVVCRIERISEFLSTAIAIELVKSLNAFCTVPPLAQGWLVIVLCPISILLIGRLIWVRVSIVNKRVFLLLLHYP